MDSVLRLKDGVDPSRILQGWLTPMQKVHEVRAWRRAAQHMAARKEKEGGSQDKNSPF